MVPTHCPATPLREASPFFHLWATHQNPRSFSLVKAKKKTQMSPIILNQMQNQVQINKNK